MRTTIVRIAIFNESFWNKGLIESQNLQPLKILAKKDKRYQIEVTAFISLLEIIRSWKLILRYIEQQRSEGVIFKVFPILYLPSRLFYPRWFMLPTLLLNTFPYILYLLIVDRKTKHKVYYNLRSYEIALCFSLLYRYPDRLVFDPRTDMILEQVTIGTWKEKSISYKIWRILECYIITHTCKTLFISEPMRDDILDRCSLDHQENKYIVHYNQVDFERFYTQEHTKDISFLYSGTLGHYNDFSFYLKFMKVAIKKWPDAILHVVTNTRPNLFIGELAKPEFKELSKNVKFHLAPKYEEIPKIYSICNYGLQLMRNADSRMGVKYVEYIAAGLTPIVNDKVKGAVQFSRKMKVGIVIEDYSLDHLIKFLAEQIEQNISPAPNWENIRELIDMNLSYGILAQIFD
jgi:glycosyltransferase involved in cell wall biosynthesis